MFRKGEIAAFTLPYLNERKLLSSGNTGVVEQPLTKILRNKSKTIRRRLELPEKRIFVSSRGPVTPLQLPHSAVLCCTQRALLPL